VAVADPLEHLPNMATKAEVARFLRCSIDIVDGMLKRGEIRFIKLGRRRNAPVRIVREHLLEDLNVVPKATARRRRQQAEHELASCYARLGMGGDS
jgi:excisionase family DNA binding protein